MSIVERIDLLCKEKGISKRKMESEAGIPIGSCSKWKSKGFNPNQKTLNKLSEFFNVSGAYLLGESEFRNEEEAMIHGWAEKYDEEALSDESRRFEAGARIPVLGSVPCGIPTEAIEDIIDWEEIPLKMAKTGSFYGLKAKGVSMYPRVFEGDYLIVKQQDDVESGEIAIVKIDDEACCKKLLKRTDHYILQSLNPEFEPIVVNQVEIVGKVVEVRAKL